MSERRQRRWLAEYATVAGLLLLGLVLRLVAASQHWAWFDEQHPSVWEKSKLELSQDANQYIQQANPGTWASPLHESWAKQTFFRPPLPSYYFVALFRAVAFDRMLAATVQALLATLAYLFLFLAARRIFGRTVALITLAAVALHPVLMFYDVSFEDSTLAVVLLSATLYLVLWARDGRALRWALPGTTAGLLILTRPNLLVVVAGIAVLLAGWLGKARVKALLAFLVPIACLVAPVVRHNHAVSNRWIAIADSAGKNLFWGNGPFPDYRIGIQGYWNILMVDRGSPAALLVKGLKARTGKLAVDDAFMAETVSYLKARPGQVALGFLHKGWRHLSSYEIPRNTHFEALRANVWLWRLPYVPFSVLLVLALVGTRGLDKRLTWLLLLPWLAAVLSEVVFFNASRYRALCVPFLVPFAIRALFSGYTALNVRRWRDILLATAVAGVAFAAGAFAVSARERVRYQAVDHFKDAMLESYADQDAGWQRFSENRFLRSLAAARRLDPENLDAFAVEQKYRITNGKVDEVVSATNQREGRCRAGEWLCHDLCSYLRRMVGR